MTLRVTEPALRALVERTIKEHCPTCGHLRDRWNGAYLRSIREQSGESLRALARKAGVSAAYVCDVEWNRRNPNGDLLRAYRELQYWEPHR